MVGLEDREEQCNVPQGDKTGHGSTAGRAVDQCLQHQVKKHSSRTAPVQGKQYRGNSDTSTRSSTRTRSTPFAYNRVRNQVAAGERLDRLSGRGGVNVWACLRGPRPLWRW